MDAYRNAPRYPQHHHPHQHQQHQVTPPSASSSAYYPASRSSIDVDVLGGGLQRYLPNPAPGPGPVQGPAHPQAHPRPASYPHNNSTYISLPPGVDPLTFDFRQFYPYNPSEVKHRKRTTRPQLKVLEETFKRETKPNAALRKTLAAQLEMTPRGVQVWFQNRRAKEKTLAKKASSSTANGRKSISLGVQNDDGAGDVDADVDCDDGDVAAEDEILSSEHAAHHPGQAPGTAYAMDEGRRSHSSSNSPEDTSPELTPPIAPADIPPHVSVSPPADDDSTSAPAMPEPKLMGNGLPPTWPGPPRSMSRTPTSRICAEYPAEQGLGLPGQDHFSRRPSLPTHLTPARMRASHYGSPRLLNGGVNAARLGMGFDPNARRMSLDRLASHPYAHLVTQANSVVYGTAGMPRFKPSLPTTTQSTPTLTPQAHNAELPPVHGGNGNGSDSTGSGHTSDSGSNSGLPELSLPPHLQAQTQSQTSLVGSAPDSDVRPELMHRQSLPAHLAMPPRFGSSSAGTVAPPQSASASTAHMPMRFPRADHVYALSTRNYQPPIAGPLPNPDFSFGSVGNGNGNGHGHDDASGNGEGEGARTDGARTPENQLQAQLSSYQFPQADDGKDEGSGVGGGNGLDMEMEGVDPRGIGAPVYYVDAHGLHGAADPYASRFGSIASIASIAESESSATSGSFFNSETSSYNMQHDELSSVGHSSVNYNDSRRASCTSQMMTNMFSHLDVQNGSQSSLPHAHDSREQDPHSSRVPISRSSELSLALIPDDGADNGNNMNVNMGDGSDHGSYHRASMSSSDLSHGHAPSLPATSSRPSLGIPSQRHHPRLQRIDTEDMGFLRCNFDAVSETGHYSPVSHPASVTFEFPMSGPQSRSGSASEDMDHDGGMMGRKPSSSSSSHQYGVDESCGQQTHNGSYYQMSGPYSKDGSYASQPQSTTYNSNSHSQENLPHYGYYNQ